MDLHTKWGVGAAQFGEIIREDGLAYSPVLVEPDANDGPDTNSTSDEPVLDETSANWQAKEPRWVPESRDLKGRTIVLCFDGTGEHFHETNSNVIKLVELLKKDDTTKQMVYYQTGIGTTTSPNLESSAIKKKIAKVMDLMFATTLEQHIRDGYEFLCQHYRRGDSINIFGFSRGAYTARALAGMIQKVGILPPGNMGMIPFAYEMYTSDDEKTRTTLAPGFKAAFSADAKIEFVGVWDTVKSVGLFPRHNLPFVTSNSSIRYFRHALALDEHRVKFVPSYYKPPNHPEEPERWDKKIASVDEQKHAPKSVQEDSDMFTHDNNMKIDVTRKVTDSLEVWFAGSHCDVGGGSVDNNERYSLARIPLRWMIRECFRCKTGIIFNGDELHRSLGISLTKNGKNIDRPEEITVRALPTNVILNRPPVVVNKPKTDRGSRLVETLVSILALPFKIFSWVISLFSRFKAPEEEEYEASLHKSKMEKKKVYPEDVEELYDAISPIHDELEKVPFWWFLEFLPLWVERELREFGILPNWGDGRNVFKFMIDRKMIIHRSVLTRLRAKNEWGVRSYQPRAKPTLEGNPQRLLTRDWSVEEPDDNHWLRWYDPQPNEDLKE